MEATQVAVEVMAVAVADAKEGPHQGQDTQKRQQRIIYFTWDQARMHHIMR